MPQLCPVHICVYISICHQQVLLLNHTFSSYYYDLSLNQKPRNETFLGFPLSSFLFFMNLFHSLSELGLSSSIRPICQQKQNDTVFLMQDFMHRCKAPELNGWQYSQSTVSQKLWKLRVSRKVNESIGLVNDRSSEL